jgi:signal transduction histidine kinase
MTSRSSLTPVRPKKRRSLSLSGLPSRQPDGENPHLLEIIAETSALICSSLDLSGTLRHITESIATVLGVSDSAILLLDSEGRKLVGAAGYGAASTVFHELVLNVNEKSLMVTALRERRPITSLDTAHDPRSHRETLKRLGAKSCICLPLAVKGRAIGVLMVGETRRIRTFTRQESRVAMAMAGLAAVAIENARLHTRQRMTVWEMHDGIGQVLSCIRLKSTLMADALAANDLGVLTRELDDISELCVEGDAAMRACLAQLRADGTVTELAASSIEAIVDKFQSRTGIQTELTIDGSPTKLSANVEAEFVRIIQEALRNIEIHAHASTASIRICTQDRDRLELLIQDNGRGFDPRATRPHRREHFGLGIMKQRVEQLGGKLNVHSSKGGGTTLRAVVPWR